MEPLDLRPGDLVRVKSPDSILASLDDDGTLGRMPFMPEMFDACGNVYQVYARADKTCDTATRTGGRSLTDTVHLANQRCDGANHGGCQAACLNFWKESWLERVTSDTGAIRPVDYSTDLVAKAKDAISMYAVASESEEAGQLYSCQATQLPNFTQRLSPWNPIQYWKDVARNRVPLIRVFKVGFLALYTKVVDTGVGYRFWVGIFDKLQKLRGRHPWPYRTGEQTKTPTEILRLEVGELVRIKSFEDILETLDKSGKNRGMRFDAEMVKYCGGTYRVHSRVEKIVNEETGELISFVNPCIILENVWCSSDWSECRRFCPRSIYHWWREIWLERVDTDAHRGLE